MKMKYFFLTVIIILSAAQSMAQCALCTKTAEQLGDGPASGLNKGILYLMFIPLGLLFYIGYRWFKREKLLKQEGKI
ncbi:MAG: hypothetical protein PW786_04605 [Arachidicoccus sp.]|nr:hypothetical protein [Arachidicoccus sp.]